MSYVLSGENPDTGNARETIFYCWTKQKYDTVESPVSDFEIDGKTFEVGGRNKGKKQISNLEDAYVVKDTIEYVFDNQVPLWMFGFLYWQRSRNEIRENRDKPFRPIHIFSHLTPNVPRCGNPT